MKKILMAAIAAMTLGYAGGDIVAEPEVAVAPTLTGFYVSGGYAYLDAEATDGYDTVAFTNNALDLRAGYNFSEYVAVEARYAIGAEDDVELNGFVTPFQADIDTWGVFIKPQYPVTSDATIYALLGYGNVDGTFAGVNELDENGFQWGLGAKYSVNTNVEVFVDYISAYDDEVIVDGDVLDLEVYTVTVGVTYKF
jgi:opacity protein-like surface antigen